MYFDEVRKNFGFGCMRLPMIENGKAVDIEQTKKMVDTFIEQGFNYFDTAHGYLEGKSELALKECLTSRHKREEYILTDKLTMTYFNKQEDIRPFFESQLEACGVEYFDFYLMHSQSKDIFEHFKKCRAYETALELKKEGKIHHFGISFHDKAEVLEEILKEYPQIEVYEDDSAADVLETIFEECNQERFVFVLDEWDFIFHKDFVTEENKKQYVLFLSNLLKDRSYVQLTYMTGILPIAMYSSGSELNMFWEYTMVSEAKYNEYFGFTDSEVDQLYEKYTRNTREIHISREDLKEWYDGYTTKSGERMYNPRSVVLALTNNNIGNYWTSSGPYDEIFYYIRQNIDDVQNDLALMISGEAVTAKIQEYAAVSMNLTTKNEIFSAMIVYGFLSYENGEVRIPNKELMNKFDDMIQG